MQKYDFKMLSWIDFEELCCDLLRKSFSMTVEAFKTGKDDGVDLRYTTINGQTIVQCKHYVDTGFSGLLTNLKKEKIKLEAMTPKPKFYRVLTSVDLGKVQKDKIFKLFEDYMPSQDYIWGKKEINNALDDHKDIERAHFKLWLTSTNILQKILHKETYNSTDFNILKIKDEIKLYVDNESFTKAREILEERHSLIISGPPGVGKTTLADMLMYHYIGNGFEPVYVTGHVDEIYKVVDSDLKQIIIFDDFLGAIRLEPERIQNVDRRVHDLLTFVEKSKTTRFVLTTREHVLKQSQEFSERLAESKVSYLKFILDVGVYTRFIKAKILYNHVRYSSLPPAYVDELLKHAFYRKIIDHKGFNPRIISWIGKTHFYSQIKIEDFQKTILDVLDNPALLWKVIFRSHFSTPAQNILIVASSLIDADVPFVQESFRQIHFAICKHFNIKLGPNDFERAIKEVENTFLIITPKLYQEKSSISFINPSLREFAEKEWWLNDELKNLVLPNLSYVSQLSVVFSLLEFKSAEIEKIKGPINLSIERIVDGIVKGGGVSDKSAIELAKLISGYQDTLGIDNYLKYMSALIPFFLKRAKEYNREAESIADIFEYLADSAFLGDSKLESVLEELKPIMFEASAEWNLVELFLEYSDLMSRYPQYFSSEEIKAYEDASREYIEQSYNDYSQRGSEELDEYKDNFEKLLDVWSISGRIQLSNLEDYIVELEMKMASREDYDGGDDIRNNDNIIVNDSELHNLFVSIGEGRE